MSEQTEGPAATNGEPQNPDDAIISHGGQFAQLLAALGRGGDDLIVVNHAAPAGVDGERVPMLGGYGPTATAAAGAATAAAAGHNVWFGVQRVTGIASGNSKAAGRDVAAVDVLYADLDDKNGGRAATEAVLSGLIDVYGPTRAVVDSGHGLQPYWVVEPVDIVTGALALLRHRALVVKVAEKCGTTVDTGVYDLPRILRLPGTINSKPGLPPVPATLVSVSPGVSAITEAQLREIFDSYVPAISEHTGELRTRDGNATGDRVFTDAQALAFLEEQALVPIRNTQWGAGEDFWMTLWTRSGIIASFDGMFEEDDLRAMIHQAIRDGHDGAEPNASDEYQITMGFIKGRIFDARRPNASELADQFSPFYAGPIGAASTALKADGVAGSAAFDEEQAVGGTSYDVKNPGAAYGLDVIRVSDVIVSRVKFLMQDYIPLHSTTIMPGEEGIGKSTVIAKMMADLTHGELDGEFYGRPCGVLALAFEDSTEGVVRPRLEQAGADMDQFYILRAALPTKEGEAGDAIVIPRDLPKLARFCRDHNIRALWIDSLVTTLPAELKSTTYKDVATVIKRLNEFAEENDLAVIAPWHMNKQANGSIAQKTMDSRAFRTGVRSMVYIIEDPEGPDDGLRHGIVILEKVNGSQNEGVGKTYTIDKTPYKVDEIDTFTGQSVTVEASCGVARWTGERKGALKLLREGMPVSGIKQAEGSSAKDWLEAYLDNGAQPRKVVLQHADANGFNEDQMKRAARSLGVVSTPWTLKRPKSTPLKQSIWSLPGFDLGAWAPGVVVRPVAYNPDGTPITAEDVATGDDSDYAE